MKGLNEQRATYSAAKKYWTPLENENFQEVVTFDWGGLGTCGQLYSVGTLVGYKASVVALVGCVERVIQGAFQNDDMFGYL